MTNEAPVQNRSRNDTTLPFSVFCYACTDDILLNLVQDLSDGANQTMTI